MVTTTSKIIYYEIYDEIHASLVTATDVYLTVLQDFCSTIVFAVHCIVYWYSNDTVLSVMSNLDFHAWPELSDICVTMQFCLSSLTKNLLILPPLEASHTHSMILILVLAHFDFPCTLPNQWSNSAFSLRVCECSLLSQSVSNIHGSCLSVIRHYDCHH